MKKLLFILLLCLFCSGCVTISKAELRKLKMTEYNRGRDDGFEYGFYKGRIYQITERLKQLIKE